MKAPSAMRDLLPCPPCGRQGRPGEGFLAGSNTSEPRGSAPRERDHRGGDHPVPSRTRQLSPPSPRVLQREAAGGQGVALAEGAFLSAPREARGGGSPCGPLCVSGSIAGGSPRSTLRAADLAGVRCVRGVRAERMDGFLCLCRWCCNSPGLAGAILAFGIIWHLVRVDFQGILVFEFGAVVGYR